MRLRKTSLALTTALAGFVVASASAANISPPSAKDLTVGDWEINLAKSKYACSKPPQASRRHIFDAGFGVTVVEWTGTTTDGKPFSTRYFWRYDGGEYPVSIDGPDAREGIVYKLINPHRVEFVHVDKQHKVTSTYYREVSADGQTMTQSSKFTGRDCEDLQVFERR